VTPFFSSADDAWSHLDEVQVIEQADPQDTEKTCSQRKMELTSTGADGAKAIITRLQRSGRAGPVQVTENFALLPLYANRIWIFASL